MRVFLTLSLNSCFAMFFSYLCYIFLSSSSKSWGVVCGGRYSPEIRGRGTNALVYIHKHMHICTPTFVFKIHIYYICMHVHTPTPTHTRTHKLVIKTICELCIMYYYLKFIKRCDIRNKQQIQYVIYLLI